ncbi:MAG: 2-dehydropantoate 2-reductase [Opitutae bacterium]|jgi:2-dehydropantoate 2-reductase|nr:2-dehydropantoate 2-reductase [Opitutae bacterium]MBT5717626.1 2-dehydropantoate 2-reductase [Opitutae bacterium]
MVGKIGLVGAGAVGSYYGLMLKKAGVDVRFLLRSNYEDVKSDGFTLVHHRPEKKSEKIYNLKIYKDAQEIGICDWVIIACKSTVNQDIADIISPMVDSDTALLSLQNGMGNVENLTDSFGNDRDVVGGLCFTCINRTTPNSIESLLAGYVQFGQLGKVLSSRTNAMVDVFQQAGIQVKRSDSLDEALWKKLCWNIPFNGLSIAGGGITTDLILSNRKLRHRAKVLMKEIQSAAKEYGILIEDTFLERQFSLTEPMGAYKPSSLIDFLDGKPVEIDSIWGEPLRRGQKKVVLMPELETLYSELKQVSR